MQLVATAIDADNYVSALKELAKADAIMATLPESASADGKAVAMRASLESLRQQVQALLSLKGDRKRLIQTGLSYGSNTGRNNLGNLGDSDGCC